MDVDELLQRYNRGDRRFEKLQLQECELLSAQLNEASFEGGWISDKLV